MKKVGILTFHNAYNSGAVLQAYALSEVVSQMGYECENIDYVSEKIKSAYILKRPSVSDYKSLIVYWLLKKQIIKTNKKFQCFIADKLNVSKKSYNENYYEIDNDYDILICGSDQVWNVELTNNDYAYFFKDLAKAKKISYAASFGKYKFNDYVFGTIKECLSSFNSIAVREFKAKEIIENGMGLSADLVLDPVFLLDKDIWLQKMNIQKNEGGYILLHMLHDNPKMIKIAKEISTQQNKKVLMMSNSIEERWIKSIRGCGPVDFLSLIYNADLVISDSFHAVSFSLIFNKPLLIGKKDGKNEELNSRMMTLDRLFSIKKAFIDAEADYNLDYRIINKQIRMEKDKSLEYLRNSLEYENRRM